MVGIFSGDSVAPVGGSRQPDRRGEKRVLPPRETAAAQCVCVVKVGVPSYQH